MPASKIQDEAEVVRWFEQGRTYQWMCEEYERKYNIATVPSMWGNFRRRRGLNRRIVRNDALLPWLVEEQHRWDYDPKMLRLEARRRAGAALARDDQQRLSTWRARLDASDLVIDYDRTHGFRRVPRRPGVDLDLVRVPPLPTTKQRPRDEYEPPCA